MYDKIKKILYTVFITSMVAFVFGKTLVYAADPSIPNTWRNFNLGYSNDKSAGKIEAAKDSDTKITDGFGVYIKLIRYDKNTKTETISGTPILLYSGDLLKNITEVDSGAGSASSSGGNKKLVACVGGGCSKLSGVYTLSGGDSDESVAGHNYYIVGNISSGNNGAGNYTTYEISMVNDNGQWKAAESCHKSSSNVYSAEQISYYKRANIRYSFEKTSQGMIDDDIKKLQSESGVTIIASSQYDLSSSNIDGKGNLYDYINKCLLGSMNCDSDKNKDTKIFRDNGGRGNVTIAKLNEAFKANIDFSKMEEYYISVEPVTRERTSVSVRDWVTSQTSSGSGGSPSWKWVCEFGGTTTTSSPSAPAVGSDGCTKEVTDEKTCSPDDSHKYNWDCSTTKTIKGWWGSPSCASYSYSYVSTLITNHSDRISVIQPARVYNNDGNGKVNARVAKISNLISHQETKHQVLDSNNKPTGEYEYYIGPTLKEGLVGTTTNNKYRLADNNTSKVPSYSRTGPTHPAYSVGVGYWWIADLTSCKKECGNGGNTDEFLTCSENYCDNAIGYDTRANLVKLKRKCIIDFCGYWYGKDPNTGDTSPKNPNKQSVDSCANKNPYKGMGKSRLTPDATSTCSMSNGEKLENIKAVYIPKCDGDKITDFDKNDTNEEPKAFDMRTYINVACKETSAFSFADLSKKTYAAGEGLDYFAKLIGEKECTVYFNLEQWKFDYATIPYEDKVRQNRMKHIYTVYNNALIDGYNYKNSGYWTKIYNEKTGKMEDAFDENTGMVPWSSYEYDIDKVSVMSSVTETIRNKLEVGNLVNLINTKVEENKNQTIIGNETITMIKRNATSTATVNKYLQLSEVKAYYEFDKACVKADGKGTVYKPTGDICSTTKINDVEVELPAFNRYYTSLNATPNKRFTSNTLYHDVESTVSVETEKGSGSNYYENKDICEYKIDGNAKATCKIIIEEDEGTEPLGNDIYEGEKVSVKAYIKYTDNLASDDGIQSVKLKVRGEEQALKDYRATIKIKNEKTQAIEDVDIVGEITTKGSEKLGEPSKVATCEKTIYLLQHTKCGMKCEIKKISDTLYKVISTGNTPYLDPVRVSTPDKKNEIHPTDGYFYSLSTDMTRRRIMPTVSEEESQYYVRLTEPLKTLESSDENVRKTSNFIGYKIDPRILFGYVQNMKNLEEETKDGFCRDYCRTDIDLPNCEKEYKPAETGKITKYCVLNYQDDVHNYENAIDCVDRCTAKACPNDTRNLAKVQDYCKSFSALGYKSEELCVNRCYYCPECSKSYVYRTVSINNPFPYSQDVGEGYPTGNRIIGSNWYGLSHYITDDKNDNTTVTGGNANKQVEYEIVLDMAKIKTIREDTNRRRSENLDPYTDYIYSKSVTYTDTVTGKYVSKFVHDSLGDGGFSDYFTVKPIEDK